MTISPVPADAMWLTDPAFQQMSAATDPTCPQEWCQISGVDEAGYGYQQGFWKFDIPVERVGTVLTPIDIDSFEENNDWTKAHSHLSTSSQKN